MATSLLDALAMSALAAVSVGLWTLRVALSARGTALVGAAVAGVEAVVYVVAFGRIVSDLDSSARLIGYAVGVVAGTLLGMTVDRRVSSGQSEVRVVTEDEGLVAALHEHGWPATALPGAGPAGAVLVAFVALDDPQVPRLLGDLQLIAPQAFVTVERLTSSRPVPLADGFTQLGGRAVLPAGDADMTSR
jgi:uncharacterized protein YebE (UPF0316 family)